MPRVVGKEGYRCESEKLYWVGRGEAVGRAEKVNIIEVNIVLSWRAQRSWVYPYFNTDSVVFIAN